MPVYDCGDPDCEECKRAFGPDRSKAIAFYYLRKAYYEEQDARRNKQKDSSDGSL
jgi:hypothetical protein